MSHIKTDRQTGKEREEIKSPTGTEIKMICCGNKSEAI